MVESCYHELLFLWLPMSHSPFSWARAMHHSREHSLACDTQSRMKRSSWTCATIYAYDTFFFSFFFHDHFIIVYLAFFLHGRKKEKKNHDKHLTSFMQNRYNKNSTHTLNEWTWKNDAYEYRVSVTQPGVKRRL